MKPEGRTGPEESRETTGGCEFCVDAPEQDFDYCRVCGRGLPEEPPPDALRRPLFDGRGCGHPPDPVALFTPDARPYCHCGWGLDADGGVPVEGAPGPIVHCDQCGCHLAVPVRP